MNETTELIETLRDTKSRGKRQLLDAAADTIEALMADFTSVLHEPYVSPCLFCKHLDISDFANHCSEENCELYEGGVGVIDERGKYHDWHWSCQDSNFGDCPRLENTPCHDCIQNDGKNFEWRGVQK